MPETQFGDGSPPTTAPRLGGGAVLHTCGTQLWTALALRRCHPTFASLPCHRVPTGLDVRLSARHRPTMDGRYRWASQGAFLHLRWCLPSLAGVNTEHTTSAPSPPDAHHLTGYHIWDRGLPVTAGLPPTAHARTTQLTLTLPPRLTTIRLVRFRRPPPPTVCPGYWFGYLPYFTPDLDWVGGRLDATLDFLPLTLPIAVDITL